MTLLDVKAPSAAAQAVFKFASVSEAVRQFQLSDTMHDATSHLTRVMALICEENLAVSVGLVSGEVTLVDGAIAEEQLAEALPCIHDPVALVVLFTEVPPAVGNLSIAMFLTADKLPDILSSIVINPRPLAHYLAILELTCILASVAHKQDPLARFSPIDEGALILEVRVGVGVCALAVAQLCDGVDVAHVPILGHFVLLVLADRSTLGRGHSSRNLVLFLTDLRVRHADRITVDRSGHLHLTCIDQVIVAQLH